jgi:hypothetical protein
MEKNDYAAKRDAVLKEISTLLDVTMVNFARYPTETITVISAGLAEGFQQWRKGEPLSEEQTVAFCSSMLMLHFLGRAPE